MQMQLQMQTAERKHTHNTQNNTHLTHRDTQQGLWVNNLPKERKLRLHLRLFVERRKLKRRIRGSAKPGNCSLLSVSPPACRRSQSARSQSLSERRGRTITPAQIVGTRGSYWHIWPKINLWANSPIGNAVSRLREDQLIGKRRSERQLSPSTVADRLRLLRCSALLACRQSPLWGHLSFTLSLAGGVSNR